MTTLPPLPFAIPSPDLVLNLFASVGQLLGLGAVLLGGAAWNRRRSGGTGGGVSRVWIWTLAGLWLTTSVAFLLYHLRTVDTQEARLRANLLRSSTEAGVAVGDTSLRTLGFSAQLEHPLGVDSETLERWLKEGEPVNLIDVRETEETERGAIPGSWHRRYPELSANRAGLVVDGRRTVLLCFSGNRSSELAEDFAAESIECAFLVGGYEKWIAEGRPLDLGETATRASLRELPPFENSEVLLDTEEARRLVEEEGAIFVDVRYPEDFRAGALPGAINMPLRKMRDDEVASAIAALPARPVIVPCYDKRSSFYASILGLKLSRAGWEFLGRYTLPHEYMQPGGQRDHVVAWERENGQQSLLGMLTRELVGWVRDAERAFGSLAFAVLAIVLLTRLLLLPLSWKADRDQVLGARLRADFAGLDRRHEDDPALAMRARMARQKAAGLTPLRNLLGTTIQIVLLLALFGAIARVAEGSKESLFWLPMGAPDPLHLTPLAIGGAMAWLALGGRPRAASIFKWALAAGVGVLLAWLTFGLTGAQNLYLVASLGWIIGQTSLVRASLERQHAPSPATLEGEVAPKRAIVPLAICENVQGVGKKAARLGSLVRAGLPVPPGFVLPQATIERGTDGTLAPADERALRCAHASLGAEKVAVRSSGTNEDGADKSYAGVFESVLDVRADGLLDAVREVVESMNSERAMVYGESDERGGVLVQAMVPAEFAGVMFTEHPSNAGAMMIELVEGLGEDLVGGRATPRGFVFGRLTGELHGDDAPPIDLGPLLELGRRVEALYGCAQDVEWAYANGRFLLLQARDVTACASRRHDDYGLREAERARLVELARRAAPDWNEPLLQQNELTELLPSPTPMSLAMMRSMWTAGGCVDLACRSFGIPYDALEDSPSLVLGAFGTLWVDRVEERRRRGDLSALAAFRLARNAESIAREFRQVVRPRVERRVRVFEWCDLDRRTGPELIDLFDEVRGRFLGYTYVEAERINIAADLYLQDARRRLEREGLDPADSLAHIETTVVGRSFELLRGIRRGTARLDEYLELFGHRAPHDFELAEPRWVEIPHRVVELAKRTVDTKSPSEEELRREEIESEDALHHGRLMALEVARARDFQVLKEEAKHVALREYAVLRRILVALGSRSGLGEDVFWLEPNELHELDFASPDCVPEAVRERIRARRRHADAFADLVLPSKLSPRDLERLDLRGIGPALQPAIGSDGLCGSHVAGNHEVVAVVRALEHAGDLGEFRDGEVLVTRFTDPTWAAVFPRAAGLVTEVGGWLSHAAIQAREYGIACIAGAEGALSVLETGDLVRLSLDGRVTKLSDRRRHDRRSAGDESEVQVIVGETLYSGELRDHSRGGAALQLDGEEAIVEITPGREVELIGLEPRPVRARVARREEDGLLALEFVAGPQLASRGGLGAPPAKLPTRPAAARRRPPSDD